MTMINLKAQAAAAKTEREKKAKRAVESYIEVAFSNYGGTAGYLYVNDGNSNTISLKLTAEELKQLQDAIYKVRIDIAKTENAEKERQLKAELAKLQAGKVATFTSSPW